MPLADRCEACSCYIEYLLESGTFPTLSSLEPIQHTRESRMTLKARISFPRMSCEMRMLRYDKRLKCPDSYWSQVMQRQARPGRLLRQYGRSSQIIS